MREIDELTQVDDPAWPQLQEAFTGSGVSVRVLAPEPEEGRRCLAQLQVTARSTLGALALNCGGLVLDGGWVRVFGGGSPAHGGCRAWPGSTAFPLLPTTPGIPRPASSWARTSWAGCSR